MKELDSLTGVRVLSVKDIAERVSGMSGSDIQDSLNGVEVEVRLNENGIKSIQDHPRIAYLFRKMSLNGIRKTKNKKS
ncbi:MAG: hypothetical protein ACKPBB_10150 [Sphaerospermopsis kisseleviana]